ncbi:DUF2785 domain-containing protein [Virgibacillus kekensis]|uniref:DUF2785 domain-containing protein n=1 Tax=Virgibacillus kekensis TaxID=202261 RepID=A0ABV9DQP4_9BACI
MKLKETLEILNDKDNFSVENVDLYNLIDSMLVNIGTTDPVLRDTLMYTTFGKLVMEDYLSEEQMKYILRVSLDNEHLFFKIGERDSDSVFTRSFSALVVALILEKEKQDRFLEPEILVNTTNASLTYLSKERDIRGYVEEKGWAHSIAHGADMLEGAIRGKDFDRDLTGRCLETIKVCLFKGEAGDGPYIDDEEERLIFAVEALLDKGLPAEALDNWVVGLSESLQDVWNEEGFSLLFFRKKSNVLNFLKALYFRLAFRGECSGVRESIQSLLKQWHDKFYSHGD